jgi:hypothetical protein
MKLTGYLLFVLAEGLLMYAAQMAAIRGQPAECAFAIVFIVFGFGLSYLHLRRTPR